MAVSVHVPAQEIIDGLTAWARHRGPHVAACVELLIKYDWPQKAAFRQVLRQPAAEPEMYVIDFEVARLAFDRGDFTGIGGSCNVHVLDYALALGEGRFATYKQGPHAASDMVAALIQALGGAQALMISY